MGTQNNFLMHDTHRLQFRRVLNESKGIPHKITDKQAIALNQELGAPVAFHTNANFHECDRVLTILDMRRQIR